jgi:hypothetical protein
MKQLLSTFTTRTDSLTAAATEPLPERRPRYRLHRATTMSFCRTPLA